MYSFHLVSDDVILAEIGEAMHESSLHFGLKQFFTQDGGFTEWWVDGYLVDVFKDGSLIEIQTGNFGAIKTKLERLLEKHTVHVVYPVAFEKIILLKNTDNDIIRRRKSPKRGHVEDVFNELVYIIDAVRHANFSLEVLLTSEEEERVKDGLGSWRRGGVSIRDRRLVCILGRESVGELSEFCRFIPNNLICDFTNADLAKQLKIAMRLASKMTYCMSRWGILEKTGKKGKAFLFSKNCSSGE